MRSANESKRRAGQRRRDSTTLPVTVGRGVTTASESPGPPSLAVGGSRSSEAASTVDCSFCCEASGSGTRQRSRQNPLFDNSRP